MQGNNWGTRLQQRIVNGMQANVRGERHAAVYFIQAARLSEAQESCILVQVDIGDKGFSINEVMRALEKLMTLNKSKEKGTNYLNTALPDDIDYQIDTDWNYRGNNEDKEQDDGEGSFHQNLEDFEIDNEGE